MVLVITVAMDIIVAVAGVTDMVMAMAGATVEMVADGKKFY